MHRDASAICNRLKRALAYRIEPEVFEARATASVAAWHVRGEPVPFSFAIDQPFEEIFAGDRWGQPWGTTWLRIEATTPPEWVGRRVELVVELGFSEEQDGFQSEGLAYSASGEPIKGIHPRSRWIPVSESAAAGETVFVYVEAASNPIILHSAGAIGKDFDFSPTPLGDLTTAGRAPQYVFGDTRLVLVDENVRALVNDLRVLSELSEELPAESGRRWAILVGIERALDVLDAIGVRPGAAQARAVLYPLLSQPAESSAHTLSAIGHAHIDSAWVWPFRETRRKVARTVANVLQLMDEDPDLLYAMSTAQQYAWIKEDHPQLFERLRDRVREGRFIPVGGMWVESDTNMPSGEALVRQLLHGTRFFEEEFGINTSIGWLPDSFGYSAALPQILKQAGICRFITQKISWNSTNRFPHHTFWWEGIDGSRVFTHFPSADMYNSKLTGSEVAHAGRNFEEKGWANRSLIPFGYGDGGGGPTREMMARARSMRDLEGSPRVRVEPPQAFFDASEAEHGRTAAVWLGEMFLEFHLGIFTSQAAMKRGNRLVERLFREAELWASQATVRFETDYPYDRLDELWKAALLLQFHDVLPGTSIAWVHQEAAVEYERIATELRSIIDSSIAAVSRHAEVGAIEANPRERRMAANASPFRRAGVSPHSIGELEEAGGQVEGEASAAGGFILTNDHLVVSIGADGTVVGLIDRKSGREVVPAGKQLNMLQLHPDKPASWDAWDLDKSYRNQVVDVINVESIDLSRDVDGGVSVRVTREFGSSTATQTVTLRPNSSSVDFATEIDWQERERILKVAMPTTVATDRWAAETQFGHVFRPTHSNTTWDSAKFEACAHRWVQIAEPGFAIAIVNEHTYGHEVRRTGSGDASSVGTTIRLSLLRAPGYPDPGADRGVHRMRHSIVVDASIGDAVRAGYELTDPIRPVTGAAPLGALLESSNPAVVIDTVKMAEDRTGDVVVRTYESHGTSCATNLSPSSDLSTGWEVDLLERPLGAGENLSRAELGRSNFRPFQIRTFRFRTKQN